MQKLAPKHQKLIRRCYPPGREVDKKPNASELSYLLYYVSTRRIKLGKVAVFLEGKAQRDVARGRAGNVQVTLDITRALIERVPEDLNVFAPNVVNILLTVLSSSDLSLARRAASVWAAFCKHHDGALFAGDDAFYQSFRTLVLSYVEIGGSIRKGPNSRQWQAVGISAASALAGSPALGTPAGQHEIGEIVPMLLRALSGHSLAELAPAMDRYLQDDGDENESREGAGDVSDTDVETGGAGGDRVAAMAAASLRRLFDMSVGSRVRRAARAIPEWILSENGVDKPLPPTGSTNGAPAAAAAATTGQTADAAGPGQAVPARNNQQLPQPHHHHRLRRHLGYDNAASETAAAVAPKSDAAWATNLMVTCAMWTPVHLRFIVVAALMEVLQRLPVEQIQGQILVVRLVTALLSSQVTMVGLAVVDVLQALHSRQHAVLSATGAAGDDPQTEAGRLVVALRDCMAALSTHTYYADQVHDMIAEVLARATRATSVSPTADGDSRSRSSSAVQTPSRRMTGASNGNPDGKPNGTSNGTRSATAAAAATPTKSQAAKAVLAASTPHPESVVVNDLRNVSQIIRVAADKAGTGHDGLRVPLTVWLGTQGLLNHESSRVVVEYVTAFALYMEKCAGAYLSGGPGATPGTTQASRRKSLGATQQPVERRASNASDVDVGFAVKRLVQAAITSAMEPSSRPHKYVAVYYLLVIVVQCFASEPSLVVNAVVPWALALQDYGVQVEHDAFHQGHTIEQGVAMTSMSLALLGTVAHNLGRQDLYEAVSAEIVRRKDASVWLDGFELPLQRSLQQLLLEQQQRPVDHAAAAATEPFARATVASYFDMPPDVKEAIFMEAPRPEDASTAAATDHGSVPHPRSIRQLSKRTASFAHSSFGDGAGTSPEPVPSAAAAAAHEHPANRYLGVSELAPRVNDLKRVASSKGFNGAALLPSLPHTAASSNRTQSIYSARSTISPGAGDESSEYDQPTPIAKPGPAAATPTPATASNGPPPTIDVSDFLSTLSISARGRAV